MCRASRVAPNVPSLHIAKDLLGLGDSSQHPDASTGRALLLESGFQHGETTLAGIAAVASPS